VTTEVVKKDAEVTDLVPQKIGGVNVPRTVEALEKLLEANKSKAWPLPFRADVLPDQAQVLLYSMGGIPRYIAPNNVMIFAGRPYIDADGVIDAAIDQGCDVRTERNIEILGCLDPQSGCPGEVTKTKYVNGKPEKYVVKATPTDVSYTATAHVRKPSGGRFTAYAQCCPHTWHGEAKHRQQMARTRALRVAAKRALGISSSAVRAEDDPIDAEVVPEDDKGEGGSSEAPATEQAAAARADADDPGNAGEQTVASSEPTANETDGGDPGSPPSADDVIYVGLLGVPYAGDGPWKAEARGELRAQTQIGKAETLLEKLALQPGALAPICKARFRVALSQASKVALDELVTWLESQVAIASSKPTPTEEEPPF
jgi:hypothetical protein